MKKYFYMTAMLALVGSMMTQTAKAQQVDMNTGLVVWKGSTVQDALDITAQGGFFFLIEYKEELNVNDKELYVAARGAYGVQAVMSSVGMRMQIVESTPATILGGNQPNTAYQLISRIENADHNAGYLGDRMGIDNEDAWGNTAGHSIYLDRSKNRTYWDGDTRNCNNFPNWTFNVSTSYKENVRYKGDANPRREEITTYTIQNVDTRSANNWDYPQYTYRANYIKIQDGKLVTTFNENEASKFIIVSETDFDTAMQTVTWGEVDLGVFVQDATFGRDNKDGKYWVWETNGEGGNAVVDNNGKTLDGMNLNTNPPHWHQRNQDFMCNGHMIANGITKSQIGDNVTGGGDDNVNHDDFRNYYGQYYSAEIYNEVNSLTQTLHCATIPNLVNGLYKFSAQALYYDDVNGLTNDIDPVTGEPVAYFLVRRVEYDEHGNIIPEKTQEDHIPIIAMKKEDAAYNNITPHSGISAGYVFNNNDNAYVLETFVEITGTTDLTIGIVQTKPVGWTVIGNVHLFAHGVQSMYVDEDWRVEETLTYMEGDNEITETGNPYTLARWHDHYDYPATFYYQRTFTVDKWNPICLPLDLTGRQVRQAFGADAKVCSFQGQHETQKTLLYFTCPLDLNQAENLDKTVIEAGKPYIIYVSNNPQFPTGLSAEIGNGNPENGELNHTMEIDGPTYAILGVFKKQYEAYHEKVGDNWVLKAPQVVTGKGGFKMVGSFYRTKINKDTINNERTGKGGLSDCWVITKGDMYHLTGNSDYNIWGTYAYVYLPKEAGGNAADYSFAIDDGSFVTEIIPIEGISIEDRNKAKEYDIYSLSGQKVGKGSTDGLKSGIYLINGKKVVVR